MQSIKLFVSFKFPYSLQSEPGLRDREIDSPAAIDRESEIFVIQLLRTITFSERILAFNIRRVEDPALYLS